MDKNGSPGPWEHWSGEQTLSEPAASGELYDPRVSTWPALFGISHYLGYPILESWWARLPATVVPSQKNDWEKQLPRLAISWLPSRNRKKALEQPAQKT